MNNNTELKHVIHTSQFNREMLEKLFELTTTMEKQEGSEALTSFLKGKILATLFYEPSTRTRLSFESAMLKLGGSVITTENAEVSSAAAKGESLSDAIRVISGYADVIVLRHHEAGSAKIASEVSSVPVINAGDGSGEHPTQALLDLYTIQKEFGNIDDISIAIVGDLKKARQVGSLAFLLANFSNIKIYFASPENTRIKDEVKAHLRERGVWFTEESGLRDIAPRVDIVYMVRRRKEYGTSFATPEAFVMNQKILDTMKEHSIVMNALPRNEEIDPEIDQDKRAAYFRQTKNGVYIRMALLHMIFS